MQVVKEDMIEGEKGLSFEEAVNLLGTYFRGRGR